MLKVDAPHLGGRNQRSTFRTDRSERRPHFFEIDPPGARHDPTILIRDHNGAELQPRMHRSWGLNPPPSAEANCRLSAKTTQFPLYSNPFLHFYITDKPCYVCYRTTRSDYLTRYAYPVRRVSKCASKTSHNKSTSKIGPTLQLGRFCACRLQGVGMTAYNSRRYETCLLGGALQDRVLPKPNGS